MPGDWAFWGNYERKFVAGPRAGKSEVITSAQFEVHKKEAEDIYGRYIPGGLFSSPRFIPGTKRSSLPLMGGPLGIDKIGYVDEEGVHLYSAPFPGVS